MNTEYLKNSLQYLERELGKGTLKYSAVQADKIKQALINESEKSLEAAFDYLILNHTILPTPQKLIDAVRIEASKRRESDWTKEKKEYQKPLTANTELAKGALNIIKQFFQNEDENGFITPVDYKNILSDAQAMAIRHPESGWRDIYDEWRGKWTAEGKL